MAPPGIKVIIRECAEDCVSWYPHALSGWYIGPILEHYSCHQTWIPSTNSVCIEQTLSWFPYKLTTTIATATDIVIANAKYLTAELKQTNKNPLLPPSDTITRIIIFQINFIFSNYSSALKSQKYPIFKLPRVPTPKPVAAPPSFSPPTAQVFHNIYPTTQKYCRYLRPTKAKNYPKNHPFLIHNLHSSLILGVALASLITPMLTLKLLIFLPNYNN